MHLTSAASNCIMSKFVRSESCIWLDEQCPLHPVEDTYVVPYSILHSNTLHYDKRTSHETQATLYAQF